MDEKWKNEMEENKGRLKKMKKQEPISNAQTYNGRYFLRQQVVRNACGYSPRHAIISNLRNVKSTDNCDTKCSINQLPIEILVRIFSFCSVEELCTNLAPVCRKWYVAAYVPALWRKLIFKGCSVPTETVLRLLKRTTSLKSLVLVHRHDVKDILSEVCTSHRQLQQITIKRCIFRESGYPFNIPANLLVRLVRCCKNLKLIDMTGMHFRSNRFLCLLGSLKKLETVKLHLDPSYASQSLKALGENCKGLKELKLMGLHYFFFNGLQNTDYKYASLFSKFQYTLVTLKIEALGLSNEACIAISKCINLRTLFIFNAMFVTDVGFQALGDLTKLISLKINKGYEIQGRSVSNVFWKGNMGTLLYLNLAGCCFMSDTCMRKIASQSTKLRYFSVAGCNFITDQGLNAILSSCPELQYLKINDAHNITGSSFAAIPKCTPHLEVLVIEKNCESNKRRSIQKLLEELPNLKIRIL